MHLFLRKDAQRLTEDVLEAAAEGPEQGAGAAKGAAPVRLDQGSAPEAGRETIHIFTVASGHM